jgi:phosphoribosylamine--glycine ligase
MTFHAGSTDHDWKLVTDGGRVLCVTALGDSIRRAQQAAYDAVNLTLFEGRQYRRDIGWRALTDHSRHD